MKHKRGLPRLWYVLFKFNAYSTSKEVSLLKVKEGDVLICKSKDCTVELTVTKACDSKTCGVECDIKATCHNKPMELKKK